MADDGDPTTASSSDQTQPLPPAPHPQAEGPGERAGGWRPGQVAVVALLALLLGGAGGALIYFLSDDQSPDDSELAGDATTTTTSTTATTSRSSTTTDASTSSTTDEPRSDATTTVPDASGGGETAVGNSIFSATYQSSQDRSTGEFSVDSDWQIRWDVPTGAVTLEVYELGGGLVDVIEARGLGVRRFADAGSYRVEIDTDGSRYTVVITDGP